MPKILIVDDNEQNLFMLQVLLKGHGYEVVSAKDGAEALEKARRDPPDMIITDILMPVMDGFALCREWKKDQVLKTVPFVFYTATYTDPRDKELALNLGAERFIIKPMEIDAFLEMVREVLEDHETGKLLASGEQVAEEAVYLKEYNGVLFRKLEDKLLQLEEAYRALERDITERKKVETTLQLERNKLTAILDSMADGVYIVNQQNDIEYINPVIQREFGSVDGRKCYEYFHDLKDVCPWCKNKDVFAGKTVHWEWYSFKNQKTYDLIDTPLRNPDGSISKLEIFRDITERKRTKMEKDALRKNLESLWGLAQLAEQDMKTLCDYVLKQIAERTASPYVSYGFLNEDESEYIVYSWSPGVMEDCKMQDKPRIFPVEKAGLWAEAIRNRAPIIINDYDKAHPGKKGLPEGHVPLKRLMIVPVFSQGRITAMAAVANKEAEYQEEDIKQLSAFLTSAQIIMDRKKAEEKIRQQHEFLNNVLESLTHPFYVIDVDDYTVKLANSAVQLNNISKITTCYALTHGRNKPCEGKENLCPLEEIKKTGKPVTVEHTHYDKERNARNLEVHAYPIFDEKGNISQMIEYNIDITERKKAEEQIAKLAKFPAENPNPVLRISGRGTVVYANKSGAILLKAWDCRVGKSLPEPWNELVLDALSSGQNQQSEVTCDGRIFSLTFAPLVKANYVNVYGHDITERKKAEEEIVNNVIKHASADNVKVSIADVEGNIVISVKDDGKGFDVDDKEKLRFNKHHGYGLFNIRERLRDFGGTMAINSEFGKGTEIILLLPLNVE